VPSIPIDILGKKYPGLTDLEIAKRYAEEEGLHLILRYKQRGHSKYQDFGLCWSQEQVAGYFSSPYCCDIEVLYDDGILQIGGGPRPREAAPSAPPAGVVPNVVQIGARLDDAVHICSWCKATFEKSRSSTGQALLLLVHKAEAGIGACYGGEFVRRGTAGRFSATVFCSAECARAWAAKGVSLARCTWCGKEVPQDSFRRGGFGEPYCATGVCYGTAGALLADLYGWP